MEASAVVAPVQSGHVVAEGGTEVAAYIYSHD